MAAPARRLARAPRRAFTAAEILRLARFPAIRRAISGGLARQTPLSVDIPKGGRYVRFRLVEPRRFHPSLFATMALGTRGTKAVIGTPLSAVHKRRELASFLRRMGARLKGAGRKGMIYQLRGAGIIGPSKLQSVLVPVSRVAQVAARFIASPRLRKVLGNPILATLGLNPRIQRDGKTVLTGDVLEVMPRRMSDVLRIETASAILTDASSKPNPRRRARRNARPTRQVMPRRVPKGRADEIAAALRRRGYTALTYAAYPGKVWSTAPKALVKAVVRRNGPVLPTAAFNRRRPRRNADPFPMLNRGRRARRNPLTETEAGAILSCVAKHLNCAMYYLRGGQSAHALQHSSMALAHLNDVIAFADREKIQLRARVLQGKVLSVIAVAKGTGAQKAAARHGRVASNPVLPYAAFNRRKKCPPGMVRRGGRCVPKNTRRRSRRNADPFPMTNRGRRPRRNPETQEIRVPFRDGQKVTPARMRAWLRSLPEGQVKRNIVRRFELGIKQYKRFHLGAEPKNFTYRAIQMGSAGKQITDVDVVVSEGKEWAATYQVPRHSKKYEGKGADGRYIHTHGDESGAKLEVDIKRPAAKRLLPERFHTADGKFVGVVPSRNVTITDWYRG
jgi:hypothetical protein